MFDKFERFNRQLGSWFERIGIVAMLLMMVVTCVDVVGAKVFNWRLLGAIDFVMLSQIVAIAFASCMVLLLGQHIEVEFFINLLPRRAQTVINIIILFLVVGLFSVIIWRLVTLGNSYRMSGEYSPTAYIPLYPFAYAIAFASIPVCLVLIMQFLQSIAKRIQK